jgi:hypothetical protein
MGLRPTQANEKLLPFTALYGSAIRPLVIPGAKRRNLQFCGFQRGPFRPCVGGSPRIDAGEERFSAPEKSPTTIMRFSAGAFSWSSHTLFSSPSVEN